MKSQQVNEASYAVARNFLLAHPGEWFFSADIARATGAPQNSISRALSAMSRKVAKEQVVSREVQQPSQKALNQYRLGELPPTNLAGRVQRWMRKHRKAVVPSTVAKALNVKPREVAAVLEAMRQEGEAVSCERLLGTGADRFEYRLMGIA